MGGRIAIGVGRSRTPSASHPRARHPPTRRRRYDRTMRRPQKERFWLPPPWHGQIKEAALMATAKITGAPKAPEAPKEAPATHTPVKVTPKKTIDDFVIFEEMGQGAYGQVKLARYQGDGQEVRAQVRHEAPHPRRHVDPR